MAAEQVALLDEIDPAAEKYFRDCGLDVITFDRSIEVDELTKLASQAAAVGVRSGPEITAELVDQLPLLRAVGGFAVEPKVSWLALKEKGIYGVKAAEESTASVAELTIFHIIAILRGAADKVAFAKRGIWKRGGESGELAEGKTLALLGYGRIARKVAAAGTALGMEIITHDPYLDDTPGAERVTDHDEFFRRAEVLSIHVPSQDGEPIVTDRELRLMPYGSYLVNTARGSLVDEDALIEALESGHISGAGLDVLKDEPKRDGRFNNRFKNLNVNVTSHQGARTKQAEWAIALNTAHKLAKCLLMGITEDSITIPEIRGPLLDPGHQRITSYHRNVAGQVALISGALARAGISIEGEMGRAWDSSKEHAYVFVDVATQGVNPAELEAVMAEIRKDPNTIRAELVGK